MRICSGAGCLRTVQDGVRFCSECGAGTSQGKLTSMERATTDAIQGEYVTAQWKRIRPLALRKHPFCAGEGCTAMSAVVDHNVPARIMVRVCKALKLFPFQQWPGFYLLENLIGLCHSCHNKKTKVEHTQDWSVALVALLSRFMPKTQTEGEQETNILNAYRS